MEITLSISHFLVGGLFLILLAIVFYGALQVKAMLDTLSRIQTWISSRSKRLENTTNHLEAAEADITGIRQSLGFVERPADKSTDYDDAGISVHLAEFKSALVLFKQHNFGRSK